MCLLIVKHHGPWFSRLIECIAVAGILIGFASFLALTIGAATLSDLSDLDVPLLRIEGHYAQWCYLVASLLGVISFAILWHLRDFSQTLAENEQRLTSKRSAVTDTAEGPS